MRMKRRRISPSPPRGEPEARKDQLLEEEPQVVGQRRISHTFSVMWVENLGIMPCCPKLLNVIFGSMLGKVRRYILIGFLETPYLQRLMHGHAQVPFV
jgi:hypothetical protein